MKLIGSALQSIPIQPYLNGTTLDQQLLENITYRSAVSANFTNIEAFGIGYMTFCKSLYI